jgi:hypothetical protein
MESTITSKLATNSSNIIARYTILTLEYWFGTPNELSLAKLVPFEIIATLLLITVFCLIAYKLLNSKLTPPEHKFLNRAIWLTLFFGPIGWALIICRNICIVFLSARFWWLIWLGLLVLVGYYLQRYYRKTLPQSKQTFAAYQLKKRYFPKKKKKN